MLNNTTVKSLAVLAFATAAVASQALSFTTVETGNYATSTSGSTNTYTNTFAVFTTQSSDPSVAFSGGSMTITETGPIGTSGTAFTGTIKLLGATASDYLTFSLQGTLYSATSFSFSQAGTAVLTGSSGSFAAYGTGTGNLSTQFVALAQNGKNTSGNTYGSFSADVEAVPEPISLATLGLGLVGLARRRKKA